MVRGRGSASVQRGRGSQMGTRGGRIAKNVGNQNMINTNLDFGFSAQTKQSFQQRRGGYNNSSNNQQQQPNQQQNYNNNLNKRYGGGNPNNANANNTNNRYSGNNNSGNANNQGRNNNQGRPQGQNQNYNNQQGQGYNQNQGYTNQQNQNQNSQQVRNRNNNNSNYAQRNQNANSGYSNQGGYNNSGNGQQFSGNGQQFSGNSQQFSGNYGSDKPSLLGSHPNISAPPARNEASSDDILKEIGKVFLTSMTGAGGPNPGVNPMMQAKMMNFMGNQPSGPPNPARYDNFYNNGNQYTNYNPPMFHNYRGGYNPRGRGGMMNNRGGNIQGNYRNNATRGKLNNNQNRRTPGTAVSGVKRQPFKAKNNVNKNGSNLKSVTFKSLKYSIMQLHKSLDENLQPLAAFLRQIFYDLSLDNKTHFILLSRILLKHENVVKLVSYEVKKCLDKKYGEGSDAEVIKKKLDFLTEKKKKFMVEYKEAFKDQAKMDEKEKAIDDALLVLVGQNFTEEHVPKPEDYVINRDMSESDYILNFQMTFIKSCYEKFFYRLNYALMPTKKIENRVSFHTENAFLSHLIVDKIKLKTNAKLPAVLAKYCKPITHAMTKTKLENSMKSSVEMMTKLNEQVQTNISDYIASEKVSAEVLRDFADCIILFDKIATAIKYKLFKYTPYLNLSEDIKKSTFDEMVKSVYTGALDILKNNVKSSEKTFVDMVKDEVTEGEDVKPSNLIDDGDDEIEKS